MRYIKYLLISISVVFLIMVCAIGYIIYSTSYDQERLNRIIEQYDRELGLFDQNSLTAKYLNLAEGYADLGKGGNQDSRYFISDIFFYDGFISSEDVKKVKKYILPLEAKINRFLSAKGKSRTAIPKIPSPIELLDASRLMLLYADIQHLEDNRGLQWQILKHLTKVSQDLIIQKNSGLHYCVGQDILEKVLGRIGKYMQAVFINKADIISLKEIEGIIAEAKENKVSLGNIIRRDLYEQHMNIMDIQNNPKKYFDDFLRILKTIEEKPMGAEVLHVKWFDRFMMRYMPSILLKMYYRKAMKATLMSLDLDDLESHRNEILKCEIGGEVNIKSIKILSAIATYRYERDKLPRNLGLLKKEGFLHGDISDPYDRSKNLKYYITGERYFSLSSKGKKHNSILKPPDKIGDVVFEKRLIIVHSIR